ncbi:MAG: hypothetical protein EZS28_038757, partial [Streblomastix strix]
QQLQKQIKEEWRRNLGEHALQIKIGRCSRLLEASQTDILILCERSLYVLRETGEIRRQKRFDREPAFMTLFKTGEQEKGNISIQKKQNILLSTHDGVLLVLDDQIIKWASTVDRVPCSMAVGKFGDTRGLFVTLFDNGELRINYFGTDPINSKIQALESKEVNYEEVEKEMRRLRAIIRATQEISNSSGSEEVKQGKKGSAQSIKLTDLLLLRTQLPVTIDNPAERLGLRTTLVPSPSLLQGVETKLRKDYTPSPYGYEEDGDDQYYQQQQVQQGQNKEMGNNGETERGSGSRSGAVREQVQSIARGGDDK